MLNVSTATLERLMELSRAFHAREAVDFPEDAGDIGADAPDAMLGDAEELEDQEEDPILAEFRSIIDDLEPDQQQEVVALLWVGRGDFAADEWQTALEAARDDWTPETADYLIAHPLLADWLREGLESIAAD